MNPAEDYSDNDDDETQSTIATTSSSLSKSSKKSKTKIMSALEWKDRGNEYYGKKDYAKAVEAYEAGLVALANTINNNSNSNTGKNHKKKRNKKNHNNNNNNNQNQEEEKATSIALRANLAMVLLKLEDFQRAEQECTGILKEDPNNTKVLYRRALAREGNTMSSSAGSATSSTSATATVEQQKSQYIKAMDDLQQCLDIFDKMQQPLSKADKTQRNSCQTALDRLEKKYNQLLEKEENANGDTSKQNGYSNESQQQQQATKGTTHSNGIDNQNEAVLAQQKKDVMRLLMGRQMSTDKSPPPVGEAFFLLEWKWWCRWCRNVDFFYSKDNKDQQKSKDRIGKVLQMLPPGAVLPPDESDDDTDDDDENSSTAESPEKPLGPIDNSRLLPENSVYHQHWYDTSSLRPNLVRGYHYELLPREVYNALRSWYGETTPSLCRRTTDNQVVILYPPAAQSKHSLTATKHKCSACRAPGASARCKRCMSVQYCDRLCQEAHWPFHKVVCKTLSNGNNTQQEQLSADGRVGLNQLGNTCFMNSALQSLSHATPLTRHFLSGKFRADLNTSNPLGTGGKLAMAYDSVMKDLWMKSKGGSTSPTALKRAIALFAPRFAGCLQHDAQEFLAYLLDGLHEDLNRIRKAPYVEMPDVTDGQNMAIAGAEAWDAHKRRNDSLVLDTFYGQFQSTCVCPKCNRVSVSFDAYNHISLEIPQLNKLTVTIPVLVFRADSRDVPYRYGVTLRRQAIVADLRSELSGLTGIPPNRLILADVYENSIFELLHDKKPVSNIRPNDVLAAYETDPYTQSSIHAVATHSLVVIDQNGEEQRPLFGFPFMTSFDAKATCQEVWDHLWTIVERMVCPEGRKEGYADRRGKHLQEDILKVRLVNSQGQEVKIFPAEDGTATSVMPFDSKIEICKFLGEGCTENFLFLALEWKNPSDLDDDEDKLVDPKAFAAYADHKSLIEAVQKQRAQNGSKAVTLDQCFETFTKPERLDDNNKWYCSKCKEHVRALKTMKLWRLPNILIVHLKRFEFKHALRRDKLDTFVDFPLDNLDMTQHCAGFQELKTTTTGGGDAGNEQQQSPFVDAGVPAEYDLFAIINHYGRMGFGHYTAFARRWDESGMSDDWALFDDSSVRSVGSGTGPDGVVTPAAYVLFYRRRTFN